VLLSILALFIGLGSAVWYGICCTFRYHHPHAIPSRIRLDDSAWGRFLTSVADADVDFVVSLKQGEYQVDLGGTKATIGISSPTTIKVASSARSKSGRWGPRRPSSRELQPT
jgi:hypothetical protein